MKREDLLSKPNWNYKDICFFFDVKKTKAYEIMNIAKNRFNGKVPLLSNCALRDSVLLAMKTNIERETYIKERRGSDEKTL